MNTILLALFFILGEALIFGAAIFATLSAIDWFVKKT